MSKGPYMEKRAAGISAVEPYLAPPGEFCDPKEGRKKFLQ